MSREIVHSVVQKMQVIVDVVTNGFGDRLLAVAHHAVLQRGHVFEELVVAQIQLVHVVADDLEMVFDQTKGFLVLVVDVR